MNSANLTANGRDERNKAPPLKKPLPEYVVDIAGEGVPCICETSTLLPRQENTGHRAICQVHQKSVLRAWKERFEK